VLKVRKASRSVLLALVAGMGCGHLVDPPLQSDAELFIPPPVYARWWAMVEACSGISRPLSNVQWFAAQGVLLNPEGGSEQIGGYYSLASNRIVLAGSDTIEGSVVRHEMLHALVRIRGHPRAAFLERCGGIVACGPDCVHDAGPAAAPDAGTPTVMPSDLEVTANVSPTAPNSSTDGGFFSLTITVRNPFPHPVIALLRSFAGSTARSYPYDIRGVSGGIDGAHLAFDAGVTYFSAGETKRDVVDLAVAPNGFPAFRPLPGQGGDGIALSPGTYTLRGGYGDHLTEIAGVVVSQ
jgi:hypothetical protein